MIPNRLLYLVVAAGLLIAFFSCHHDLPDPTPLPVWEDLGADSVRLNTIVQTSNGILLPGQYVNLALSQDSLNKGLLVRKIASDGAGRAAFPRLYPGITYKFNCVATYQTVNLFGSGSVYLPAIPKLDSTVFLTLY